HETNILCDDPKYADFLHLPYGLTGYFDYPQGLACAKALNKPVLLDFNGHACSNCKEMEAKVWSDPDVLKRLKENFVIVALYIDDRTKLPEDEWVNSGFDGKIKKTIGKKNADFQISRFRINSSTTLTELSQPPDLGKLFIHDGKIAKRVKGKANAKENPNIPRAGSITSPLAASTKRAPTIGPVQENDTRTVVSPIKNAAISPPLSACLSVLFINLLGKISSNIPKNEAANAIKRKKNIRLGIQCVLILPAKSAPALVSDTIRPIDV
ncbi:unnamed protein product, partial [marine sediment metagenome]